jgi:hypothetical protein
MTPLRRIPYNKLIDLTSVNSLTAGLNAPVPPPQTKTAVAEGRKTNPPRAGDVIAGKT